MKTNEIKNRIDKLEIDVKKTIEERKNLESKLAGIYEEGGDPSSSLKKLTECRDSISGMVSALKSLDQRLFEVQEEEHTSLAEKFEEDEKAAYEGVFKKSSKAMTEALKKTLVPTIQKEALPALLEKINDIVGTAIFRAIDDDLGSKYNDMVPERPMKVFRDNLGNRIPEPVDAFGLEQVRR